MSDKQFSYVEGIALMLAIAWIITALHVILLGWI